MRKIYFVLSIIGLVATVFSLATVAPVNEFSDVIIIALQGLLFIICVLGILINFGSVYRTVKKLSRYGITSS